MSESDKSTQNRSIPAAGMHARVCVCVGGGGGGGEQHGIVDSGGGQRVCFDASDRRTCLLWACPARLAGGSVCCPVILCICCCWGVEPLLTLLWVVLVVLFYLQAR